MHDEDGRLDGDRLYFRRWRPAEARSDVLIAHGYGEHGGRYDYVAQALRTAGHSVWVPDHRGHGGTSGERGDIESFDAVVADLDLLVDTIGRESAGPLTLIGHSMGSAVALAYAQAHQDRLAGLVLSATVTNVPDELLALAELPEIPELPLADGVSRDPAVVAAYKSDPDVYTGPPSRGFLRAMRGVADIRARLAEIVLPVLVMHGSGDLLVSPQGLRDVVDGIASADVTARLWPGLFHEIFNEPERDDVLGVLVRWLDEHA